MRDWKRAFLPASFRGVPFFVDGDDVSGGRRLAKHEYAGGETTRVEDLGRKTPAYDVTIYTLGDVADVEAVALQGAISLPGPGFVILPIDGGFMAHAEDFRRSRSKDRNGYIGFDVTFVPASTDGGIVLSIGDVSAAVASGFSLATSSLARLF